MDRRRTITLSVKDDFSRQLLQFARELNQAGQAAENMGKRGSVSFREMNSQFFYMTQNARFVYSEFQKVFSTASEWARMGAQAERMNYALRVYAGSAEEAEKWTRAVQTAMRGTITEGEAAEQAYTLMKFGLADSAEAAGEFARMLSVVAAANPRLGGTENALAQIQLTLANMSFMRLDQLGLSVTQVKERMDELQSAMPGLSREAAFQEAVIEGLKEQADKLGEGMANVTLKQDQLSAKSLEFKEKVGRNVNDVLERAAGSALNLWSWLELLSEHDWKIVVRVTFETITGMSFEPESKTEQRVAEELRHRTQRDTQQNWDAFIGSVEDLLIETGIVSRKRQTAPPPGSSDAYKWYWENLTELQNRRDRDEVYRVYSAAERDALQAYTDMIAGMDQRGIPMQRQQTWDWGAMVPTFNFMQRRGRAGTYGLLFTEAQRQQQAEIEKFQRYYAGMQETLRRGRIDWEGAFASMWRPTAESGGIWGRAMQVSEESAEKTARGLERITEAASKLSAEAQRAGMSLEQLMGIEPTVFDASVYSAGADALREYGVDSDKAKEAMRYLALTTGQANAESEIFRLRMLGAAEALEKGELSAAGYAIQVGLLAREIERGDWDFVDKILKVPMDEEGLRQYVRTLEWLAGGGKEKLDRVVDPMVEKYKEFKNMLFGPPEVAQDPFQPLKDSYDSLAAHSEQRWQDMESYMSTWVDLSTLQVRGWKESFVREIVDVEARLNTMTSRPWSVTITSSFTEGGAGTTTSGGRTLGGRAIPEFQRGGYTGDGPHGQIAGVVHRGEYVLSQDMLRKMRQGQRAPDFPRMGPMIGGGGGGVTITGPIHVHGVQNAAQLLGELKREAARKNTRLVEAMS